MEVQCEKCGTEYSLDETLVGPSGTAVRCTSCGNVFKVFPPAGGASAGEPWMLRQVSGATFPFDRLAVLQDWISEGKVSESDLLARSGGDWKRLGDIAEMKPFFEAARNKRAGSPASQPVAAGYPAPASEGRAETMRVSASPGTGPAAAKPGSGQGQVTSSFERPAPAGSGAPIARPAVANVAGGAPTVRARVATGEAVAGRRDTRPPPAGPAKPQQPQGVDPNQQTLLQQGAPQQPQQPQGVDPNQQTLLQQGAPQQPPQGLQQAGAQPQPQQQAPQQQAPQQLEPVVPAQAQHTREPDLSQVPGSSDAAWERGRREFREEGPAWAEGRAETKPNDFDEEEDLEAPRRRPGRWIALLVVLALVGAGAYLFVFQKELVRDALDGVLSSRDDGRHETFFLKGKESFLLDTDASFRQADREFQKVMALREDHAPTLASLAQMYAVWSQYLRDERLDARADAEAAAPDGGPLDLRDAERFEQEATEKLEEAERWVEQARSADQDLPATELALADVARLRGDLEAAEEHLDAAREGADPAALGYVETMVAMERGRSPERIAERLEAAVDSEPLLRALYRRARALAAADRDEEALAALDEMLGLNPDHERARALKDRIEQGRRVALVAREEPREVAAAEAKQDAGLADAGGETGELAATEEEEPDGEEGAGGESGAERAPAAGGGAALGGGVEALLSRAAKLQESGSTSQASKLFQKVLEREPGNVDAISGLAYCHLDRGNVGAAIANFRRAVQAVGSYGPAIIGLAEAYKLQGQKAQALEWFEKYLSVHPGGRYAHMAERNSEQLRAALGKSDGDREEANRDPTEQPSDEGEASAAGGDAPGRSEPESPGAGSEPEPTGGETEGDNAPTAEE